MPVDARPRRAARKSVSFRPTVAFLVYDSPQYVAGVSDALWTATENERPPVGEGVLRPLAQPVAQRTSTVRRRSSTPVPSAMRRSLPAPMLSNTAHINNTCSTNTNTNPTAVTTVHAYNSGGSNSSGSSATNSPGCSPVSSACRSPKLLGARMPGPVSASLDRGATSPPTSRSATPQQHRRSRGHDTAAAVSVGNNIPLAARASSPIDWHERQYRTSKKLPPPISDESCEGSHDEKWQQALGIARELIKQNTVVTKSGKQIDVRGVAAAAQKVINSQRMSA